VSIDVGMQQHQLMDRFERIREYSFQSVGLSLLNQLEQVDYSIQEKNEISKNYFSSRDFLL